MTDWHTRAIIYQIDTALFYDMNGDGCGDIAGIAAKLRYIRRMGATVIWITPFYLTPFLDKRYDDALVCGKTVELTLGGYGYRWFWTHRSALR